MELPQRLARKQEIRSAAFYGASLVVKSGSGDLKGDAETDDELFEFKHTQLQSFRLRLADLVAHFRHAVVIGKRPVWEIEYTSPDGRDAKYVVVLDRDDYMELREDAWKYRELNR